MRTASEERLLRDNEFPSLPDSWRVERFRFLFRESKERNGRSPVGEMLSVSEYRGVTPRIYDHQEQRRTDEELENYRVVRPGQLAVNTMWLNHLGLGVSDNLGHVSPAYSVYEVSDRLDRRFVHHLLRSQFYLKIYLRYLYGIRPNSFQIKADDWNSIPVVVPDLDTQKAIADVLDKETARIDQLIEKKQRLVELLGERFDMQVRVATTRGRPDARELVESGVPYLGKVPADWPVEKTGWRYSVQLGKMLDGAKQTGKHLAPYLRVADVQWGEINTAALPSMDFSAADRAKFRLEPGDLIVNEGGSYVGRSAIWRGELVDCFYQKALHRLRPRDPSRDTSEYFLWVMWFATRSGVFIANGNHTTIDHLTAEAFKKYRFAFPPIDEQRQIADTLKRSRQKTGGLTASVQASIDRLKEYRSALITAAVTGQIDVTRWGQTGEGDKRLDQIQEEMAG